MGLDNNMQKSRYLYIDGDFNILSLESLQVKFQVDERNVDL